MLKKSYIKVFDDLDYDEILEKLEQAQKETRLSNSMAVMSENTFMSSKSKQEKLDRPKSGSTFMGQGFRKTVVKNALSSNIGMKTSFKMLCRSLSFVTLFKTCYMTLCLVMQMEQNDIIYSTLHSPLYMVISTTSIKMHHLSSYHQTNLL